MAKNNTAIHDNFIRSILADKSIAIEYFKEYLPKFVSAKLDFSSLIQIPDTYLSKNLRKTMSDIIYSCKTNTGTNSVKISILVEHKSYPDHNTPVQIGSYIFSGLEKQLANNEKLTVIIPVLLYHGRGRWKYKTLSGLFKDLDPELIRFIPNFDYVYNNLGEISDEQIEVLSNRFLIASILALKHTFENGWLETNAQRVLLFAEDASKNLQQNLIVYLFANSGLSEKQITDLLEELPLALKDTIMSTLDIFEKKGIEKGKSEVIKNMLINTNFSIAKIALLAGVTDQHVLRISKELNQQ